MSDDIYFSSKTTYYQLPNHLVLIMELLSPQLTQDSSPPSQQQQTPSEEKHIKEIKQQLKSSFPLIKSIESASMIQTNGKPTLFSSIRPFVRFQSSVSLDSEIVEQNDFSPKNNAQDRSQADQSYEIKGMHDSCLSKSFENSTLDFKNQNLIRFFQYVIAFKTNKIEKYQTFNNKQNVDYSMGMDWSCENKLERQSLIRSTARDTKISQTLRQTSRDISEEIDLLENLHHNYRCDICEVSPINGIRYHCNCCEDYDECEQCHTKKLHSHPLQVITKPGKNRQLQKMVNLLNRPNIANSSLAITRRGKENMKELSINRSMHC